MLGELFATMLRCLAGGGENALARQVQSLKAENEVLRARHPAKLVLTSRERTRLIDLARPLGQAVRALVSVVTPATMMLWMRGGDSVTPPP